MTSKHKVQPCRRRSIAKRPAAQPARLVRKKPVARPRRVKVSAHLRRKRPRGLTYKKAHASVPIGVCNACGELCIHCRAKAVIRLKRERCEGDPPICQRHKDDSAGDAATMADDLERDLAELIEEDRVEMR